MPDAQSEILIVVNGNARPLTEAISQASESLKQLASGSQAAGRAAGESLASGEKKATQEAKSLAEGVRVAADAVAVFGVESGETARKALYLRDAMSGLRESFGGLKGAILGGVGAMATFAAADFLKQSAEEAIQAQSAWAGLAATFKGNASAFNSAKDQIEGGARAWEHYGLSVSQVAGVIAQAKGRGITPQAILGNIGAIADTARALKTDIPSALQEITRSGRGASEVLAQLNLPQWKRNQFLQRYQNASADARLQGILNLVEQSGFAGSGAAFANSAQGQLTTYTKAMTDFKESIGTSLLPAMTSIVQAVTGIVQSLNDLLRHFGGLGQFLKVTWLPLLTLALVGFATFRAFINFISDALRSKFMPSVAGSAQSLSNAASAATTLADAIKAIPLSVDTTAAFDAATASQVKDAYIANINSIPRNPVTTATFVPAQIPAAANEGVVVTPTIGSTVGSIGAITATATITGLALSSGAMSGLTTAIGHMVGHVTKFTEARPPQVNVMGHVTGWTQNKGVHAPAVNVTGHVTKWTEATPTAPSLNITGHVTKWTEVGPPVPPLNVTGHVTKWAQGKGATTPAVQVIGQIIGWNEKNQPVLNNLTGTITKWNTGTVPVHLPKNITLNITNAQATVVKAALKAGYIPVLTAKGNVTTVSFPATVTIPRVKVGNVDLGGISSALGKLPGFSQGHPVPLYVKPQTQGGISIPTGGGSSGGSGFGGQLLQGALVGVIQSIIMSLILSKTLGGGGGLGNIGSLAGGLIKGILSGGGASDALKKQYEAQYQAYIDGMLKAAQQADKNTPAKGSPPPWATTAQTTQFVSALDKMLSHDLPAALKSSGCCSGQCTGACGSSGGASTSLTTGGKGKGKSGGTGSSTDVMSIMEQGGKDVVNWLLLGIDDSRNPVNQAGKWIVQQFVHGAKGAIQGPMQAPGYDAHHPRGKGDYEWNSKDNRWQWVWKTHGGKGIGMDAGMASLFSSLGLGGGALSMGHTTVHATINVNGARDSKDVAHEIVSALQELQRGVHSSRRRNG